MAFFSNTFSLYTLFRTCLHLIRNIMKCWLYSCRHKMCLFIKINLFIYECPTFISNPYSKSNKTNKKLRWVIYLLHDLSARKKPFPIDTQLWSEKQGTFLKTKIKTLYCIFNMKAMSNWSASHSIIHICMLNNTIIKNVYLHSFTY